MKTEGHAVHVAPGEGKALWVAGDLLTIKLAGGDTGGAFALMEELTPPQGGPPPHLHRREDETLYVLEGEYEVSVGGDTFRAGAGSVVRVPKHVLHTFRNVSTAPGRLLALKTPAGLERFFEEVGDPAAEGAAPPPFGQEQIQKLAATAPKYGVEIPPPPGVGGAS